MFARDVRLSFADPSSLELAKAVKKKKNEKKITILKMFDLKQNNWKRFQNS